MVLPSSRGASSRLPRVLQPSLAWEIPLDVQICLRGALQIVEVERHHWRSLQAAFSALKPPRQALSQRSPIADGLDFQPWPAEPYHAVLAANPCAAGL